MSDETRGWWGWSASGTGEDAVATSKYVEPDLDPSAAWSPSFAALVKLMIDGPGTEDHLVGVVSARINQPAQEFSYRVARRGDLVRCETLEGQIHYIAGRDTVWRRGADGELDVSPRRRGPHYSKPSPDDLEFGEGRPAAERWDGDDFTIPTGPETATTFLGRQAWLVELAPPAHKPHPIQMIIDAETGLILRQGNAAFDTFHEWTSLHTNADLPDSLFTFDPNTDTIPAPLNFPTDEPHDAAELRRMARQRLEYLDAMVTAIERRAEVLELVAASESTDHALAALGSLLGVSELGATAILDLQVRRFSRQERERIESERDQMRHLL